MDQGVLHGALSREQKRTRWRSGGGRRLDSGISIYWDRGICYGEL